MAKEQPAQTEKKTPPTTELGADHLVAMGLVGTVALPSPFPATGRVFVVRHPLATGTADESARTYHIKVVQKINDSCFITRFVDHSAVRMIRLQPADKVESSSVKPINLDHAGVQKMVGVLQWNVVDERASHEIEPYPQHTGVVHVPENQPVLLRYELSVPAATSLEQLLGRGGSPCPHG